jgi:hypothetical protein
MEDYKVIKIDPITRIVTLEPSIPPVKITGLEKLVQLTYLAIMNSPGRNVLNPEDGGGLVDMIGQYNLDSVDISEVLSEVTQRIEKIKEEILEYQTNLEVEDPSERLQEFTALTVEQGTNIDTIVVKFRLISEAGEIANFGI